MNRLIFIPESTGLTYKSHFAVLKLLAFAGSILLTGNFVKFP